MKIPSLINNVNTTLIDYLTHFILLIYFRALTLLDARIRNSSIGGPMDQTGGPFAFHNASSSWQPFEPESHDQTNSSDIVTGDSGSPVPLRGGDIINVVTWNIDFGSPFARQRGVTALRHIEERLSQHPYNRSVGSVILLQEVADPDTRPGPSFFRRHGDSSTLDGILEDPWVQREFLTAYTTIPGTYGNVTLMSKNIAVIANRPQTNNTSGESTGHSGCFRVPAPRGLMGRDILSVDLLLESGEHLRICNVHLDSLAIGTPIRPFQLALASQFLREQGVSSGIVAGDMNAIDTPDFTLPSREDIQLRDVWAEYNGYEAALSTDNENVSRKERSSKNEGPPTWGEEKGHTWGYLDGKCIFYPRRMDKILFRVNENAKAWIEPVEGGTLDRLGVNLRAKIVLEGDSERETVREGEERQQQEEEDNMDYLPVSDHFGLIARFIVKKSKRSSPFEE